MDAKSGLQNIRTIYRAWRAGEQSALISDLIAQGDPNESVREKMLWFIQILQWLQKNPDTDKIHARLRYLLQILDRRPEWKDQTSLIIQDLVANCNFSRFFQQTGLSTEHGLWTETTQRLFVKIFPQPLENDFYEIAMRSIDDSSDYHWIQRMPDDLLSLFAPYLIENPQVRASAIDAILILSTNLMHLGNAHEIKIRSDKKFVSTSPFFIFHTHAHEVLGKSSSGTFTSASITPQEFETLQAKLIACRLEINDIHTALEESGVSVELVYRLEMMSAVIQRIDELFALISTIPKTDRISYARELFASIYKGCIAKRSITGHVSEQFRLLSKKIAERNGYSGEKYISKTWSEAKKLFVSAMGGGVLVVVMTYLKIGLIQSALPPLIYAFSMWFIYSGGFILMQIFGLSLATKLPSFIASHLARIIVNANDGWRKAVREDSQGIVKSQLIALSGNLTGAMGLAALLNWALHFLIAENGVGESYARDTILGLHPYHSFVIGFAAITGILLWLSAIAGGWFENWIVFRRLPQALAEHPRLKKTAGAENAKKISEWVLYNSSGLAASVVLGFLLSFLPLIGLFLNLHLSPKHVTLASTEYIFVLFSFQTDFLTTQSYVWAAVGLAFVALMNFTVSFAFALFVAMRARRA